MLLELAIGDAYGAGFEYAPAEFVARHNTLDGYRQNPKYAGLRPGRYTDDTQMSIAIADHLLSGAEWTADALADRFVTAYHRDPREGYSRAMRAALEASATGAEFQAVMEARPFRSDRSGAAMRAGAIGLLGDVDEVLRCCDVQARVTHDSAGGAASARAAALAVHYCYHRLGPTSGLPGWVRRTLGGDVEWDVPWRGEVGPLGVDSVRAAVTALAGASGLTGLLGACVGFTGDVDTVAAIALAAGSCAADLDHDLPPVLARDLENGEFGRDHLSVLDARLRDRYPASG
jgi:ADP-ribosylglycohydrolase